jgi:hypothetical protein
MALIDAHYHIKRILYVINSSANMAKSFAPIPLLSKRAAEQSVFPFPFEAIMNTSKKLHEDPSPKNAERPAGAKDSHRDAQGRFIGGNPGGPGNPFARQVAEMRRALLSCITYEEMRVIGGQLVVKAKMGDLAAIKLLFQYVIGKPTDSVNPDTLDHQEMEQYQQGMTPEQMQELMTGRRQEPGELVELVRTLLPVFAEQFKNAVAESLQGNPPPDHAVEDFDDEPDDSELEEEELAEEQSPPVALQRPERRNGTESCPTTNGKMSDDARQSVPPPSPNGCPKRHNSETPPVRETPNPFAPRSPGD